MDEAKPVNRAYKAIILRLDASALRQWHVALVRRLSGAMGMAVQLDWGRCASTLPQSAEALLRFESLLHREASLGMMEPLSRTGFLEQVTSSLNSLGDTIHADPLVLDLCGDAPPAKATHWVLRSCGGHGEGAVLAALLTGAERSLALYEGGACLASARVGVENPGMMLAAMNDFAWRTISFVCAALAGWRGMARELDLSEPGLASLKQMALKGAKEVAQMAVRRLAHLAYNTPHWKVGWRWVDDDRFALTGEHPAQGWNSLPDDGQHFYADPFAFNTGAKTHIFAEDFDHRRGYATLCVFELQADGRFGPARTILDTGSHLSYPHVFAAEGEIWMVPESGTAREVCLYRASDYPLTWHKEAVLIADEEVSDATLFEHAGQWWMMGCVREGGGSYSDMLRLWQAPALRGPWRAQTLPSMIDAKFARPAGGVFRLGEALYRPVQNCSRFYGEDVRMMRITRLDAEGFDQEPVACLRPGPAWPGKRLHSYNRHGRLEVIDGQAFGRKYPFVPAR